jgi:nitrate reductase assembly molybdenum cofactor insertion protein NarJ
VLKYAAMSLLLSWPASAEVHTFYQWERLQDHDRIAFIAGYIETLTAMATAEPAQTTARHYTECLTRSRVTARELANYLREYVRARPELRGSSIQHAMDTYLNALCGRP